ncbi:DUF2793 domain-containing protein [Sphingomonas sp. TDK1]|uniref:DUF2793 domain-containing protein n=1 Tax=Sphingomonas sp. TDK1 TaxID=453247 RepID=UPI0007D9E34F|nr:DUF2793 domain-containing protein [Sphingomonas sp. TDK1]OAN64847.1 hypothetical protein A7X12_17575 [Sphingomonas sp. TDK1]
MTLSPTPRLALPLLEPGQAQKEMFHNEALALLDIASQASAAAVQNTPPTTPQPGQCWVVGAAPEGAWVGHAAALAGWTDGGWRFLEPNEGMTVWIAADMAFAVHHQGQWYQGRTFGRLFIEGRQTVGPRAPNIVEPAGGATVDAEARRAITAVLQTLRRHGLIESD